MSTYPEIFEKNQRWAERKQANDPAFFENLAREQRPEYLYIGCCDSRVTAEEMMGFGAGEVFVHRNIANVVNAVDMNVMSAIQYAVVHLNVKRIIVCGHYNCGGVKAAMKAEDLGILNSWLRTIRDVYRIHANELDDIDDEEERYKRLVELNVQEQCINVIKFAAVQKRYVEEGFPTVHGLVFDTASGRLRDLELDFPAILGDIQRIYNLTGVHLFEKP